MDIAVGGIAVHGVELDGNTRCAHYRSPVDIVAIRFRCCRSYYSCFYCHQQLAGHAVQIWSRVEFDQKAILCGACGGEFSIGQYLTCKSMCPECGAAFNPQCALHHSLYFEQIG